MNRQHEEGDDEPRRTAIWQDTINGVRSRQTWPTRWWAAHGDTLWTAGVAMSEGVDGVGVAYQPGDIVVHKHRLDDDSTTTVGGFAVYGHDGDPLTAVLDEIAKWEHVTPDRSGTVDRPGTARLTAPGTGRPLAMGWDEALATAAQHPEGAGPDEIRASLLEAGLETGDATRPGPAVWFLERNGIDLTIVEWGVDADGRYDSLAYRHIQFDDEPGPHLVTIAHSDRRERVTPQRMDDDALLAASRAIFDRIALWRNSQGGPDTKALPHPVSRAGIIRHGERPLLDLGDGRTAPSWETLVDRTATRLIEGRPAPSIDAGTPQTAPRSAPWPNAWIAAADVHPYTLHARDGRDWNKMIVRLPAGTVVDGRRLDGFALDLFASEAAMRRQAAGLDVNVRLRPDRPIELFQGRGRGRRTVTVDDPARLCSAIRTARRARTDAKIPEPPTRQDAGKPAPANDLHEEAARLLDPGMRERYRASIDLVAFTADRSWNTVDRLQTQLHAHADAGTYDPGLALKAARRVIDRTAVAWEREHGNDGVRSVADTRFTAADRQAAALILLDVLVTGTRPPAPTRSEARRTVGKEQGQSGDGRLAADPAAQDTQVPDAGRGRTSFLSRMRDRIVAALDPSDDGRRHRSAPDRRRNQTR